MSKNVYELSSRDFFDVRPKTGITAALVIIFIIIIMLIFLGILLAMFRTTGPCVNPPDPPTFLTVSKLNEVEFKVSWQASTDTNKYICYVGEESGFGRIQSISVVPTTTTSAVISALDLNKTYYIAVSSVNDCGESTNSQEISYDFV